MGGPLESRAPMPQKSTVQPRDEFFLPDFCEIRMVFSVLVIGELLAFILVLTPTGVSVDRWSDLALVSLFIQWVGLSSAGLLCLLRRHLGRLGNVRAALVSYGLVLTVTALLSEAAWWLVQMRVLDTGLLTAWELRQESYWFIQQQLVEEGANLDRHLSFMLQNLAISAIVSALALRYFYVQFQWRSQVEAAADARIQALQSRIRPHFLFNSMNTIASLTRVDPERAEQVVEDLADLFRVSLGDARIPVNLGREMEVCRHYLGIEQIRLGERLQVEWSVDALPDDALLPALTLQPLLENAVYHGIEPRADGGTIRVRGERAGRRLHIAIANPLPGDAADQRVGNRMALGNVAQRMSAFFEGNSSVTAKSMQDGYTVSIAFPYRTEVR